MPRSVSRRASRGINSSGSPRAFPASLCCQSRQRPAINSPGMRGFWIRCCLLRTSPCVAGLRRHRAACRDGCSSGLPIPVVVSKNRGARTVSGGPNLYRITPGRARSCSRAWDQTARIDLDRRASTRTTSPAGRSEESRSKGRTAGRSGRERAKECRDQLGPPGSKAPTPGSGGRGPLARSNDAQYAASLRMPAVILVGSTMNQSSRTWLYGTPGTSGPAIRVTGPSR